MRSAAYRSASRSERNALHAALADATDPRVDPDRRAWHHAHAAPGPDELVAEELERSAVRAGARGGVAAAAAFLESAATLTPEPRARASRLLAAARAKRIAGGLDSALELLSAAEAGPLSPLQAAEAEHLRGQVAFDQRRVGDAARLLISAARRSGAAGRADGAHHAPRGGRRGRLVRGPGLPGRARRGGRGCSLGATPGRLGRRNGRGAGLVRVPPDGGVRRRPAVAAACA